MSWDIQNVGWIMQHPGDANIMHFYLKSLELAALYTKLFQDLVNPSASTRKVFGGPYHSVVSHKATRYRYISLKNVAV